jgi:pilus assembly protein CpaB
MRLGARARLTTGIGVLAAAGFVVLGVRQLGRAAPQAAASAGEPARGAAANVVLLAAATRAIRTGETITAAMVRGAALNPARHPMAASPAEAIGKVATQDIPAGALIARTALDRDARLAIRVPLGMRAISIDTTAEIAVAGLLRPGDRVDVQVVYPGADAISGARGSGRSQARTLLQMVQVLAVGDSVLGAQADDGGDAPGAREKSLSPGPGAARTVTLALFPQQVAALSLARSTGTLHLSLRNPDDAAQPRIAGAVSTGPLPTSAMPPPRPAAMAPRTPTIAAAPPPPPRPRAHAIDLVVGGERRVIYSGSEAR